MSLTLRVRDVLSSERSLGWDWEVENLLKDLDSYIQNHKDGGEWYEQFLVEAYRKHRVRLLIALQEYQYE